MKKIILFTFFIYGTFQLNAQCNGNLPITENFDTNTIGICWQVNDQDGDSNNWMWWEYTAYYGGFKVIASYSFYTSTGALSPDNWIVSYPIDLTSYSTNDNIQLSWKVRGELSGFSHEFYTIYAGTSNQTSALQASPVQRGEYVDQVGGAGTWVTRSMDVSSLGGNIIYIAFRHHNSSNQYNINIDDVSISSAALGIEDFNKENFKFFYSPQGQTLSVKSTNNPISSIQIYNLLGQSVVYRKSSSFDENLNLSTLTDGIYIAQVEIDNTTKAIKFLKQ